MTAGAGDAPDGSCIRDFVSVQDLAQAHLLALRRVELGRMEGYNLGSGSGTSVKALIAAAGSVAGREVPHGVEPPRPGDPAMLVADIARAKAALGWAPPHSRIEDILATAMRWHRSPPYGYPAAEPGRRSA